jgi:hypothetical protein
MLAYDTLVGISRGTEEAKRGAVTPVVNEVLPVTVRSPRPRQLGLDARHDALQGLGA